MSGEKKFADYLPLELVEKSKSNSLNDGDRRQIAELMMKARRDHAREKGELVDDDEDDDDDESLLSMQGEERLGSKYHFPSKVTF